MIRNYLFKTLALLTNFTVVNYRIGISSLLKNLFHPGYLAVYFRRYFSLE